MPAESMIDLSRAHAQPGRAQQIATRIIFLLSGFVMSAWAPLVPFVKIRLDISDGTLGLLLLCIGAGSTFSMPLTGFLTGKLGCKTVILLATIVLCLDLPLLTLMDTTLGMALVLIIFGMSIGMVDVAMNVHAVVVEKASGRAMMSGFHGFFSIGCILGALAVSGLLSLALTPFLASIAVIAVVLLSLLGISKHLWHDTKSKQGDPMLVMPRGWVIFLGLLCFVMFLTEGAMLDWSALFLITERSVDPHNAGLGYTVFAIAMTLGRLTGDKVINYFGRFKVLLFGSLIACAGLLLSVGVDSLYAVAAGFIMVGLGASNLVPIMFSAAGNQTSMPANLAIASVTTLGYAGILAGPALVGFIAQLSNLSIALSCVAVLMLLVAASARAVTR
ncbi:MFS transporter [Rouxiella badensis]|uniref:MFS transporter n=1 Tax=Rouxiella badensis TaxID=1646377 RepID=UPI001D1380AC|nr:MFS transporter [Rouxiella badensis]MCC3720675.1 MFS transporter [Rouxiella badensis]MCC3730455.1 MFS transporter [Rouxiella badensis]MCC3734666.1 MFS transporter [Rouxiella badensis]MCC3741812.1 MFS transporter [Rouxiella badensis]MCC3760139.1 MFS transporter [Rouxiella badensis]